MDKNIDPNKLNFEDRLELLVRELALGVKEDQWTPIIRVTRVKNVAGIDQGEEWLSLGHQSYGKRLSEYLSQRWQNYQLHAYFLEGFGYFQRISDQQEFHPEVTVYRLTEKAFELLKAPTREVTVFISYRRSVSYLQALLVSNWLWRNSVENFLDIESGDGGGILDTYLQEAIRSRTHFIILLGEIEVEDGYINTLTSDWVRQEINYALQEDKVCIPIFQHNWKTENLDEAQKILYAKLEKRKGVPVITNQMDENHSSHAKAYDTALRDLLPLLNISRV